MPHRVRRTPTCSKLVVGGARLGLGQASAFAWLLCRQGVPILHAERSILHAEQEAAAL